jgi:hypothetical protein
MKQPADTRNTLPVRASYRATSLPAPSSAPFVRTDLESSFASGVELFALDIVPHLARKQFLDTVEWRLETVLVADRLRGVWRLVAWRRIGADGTISYPLGADVRGQLIYAETGRMAVQLMAAGRPELATGDPLGGDIAARAGAYSTYLAYFGTYELAGESVVHYIDGSLFPNWSDDKQIRSFTIDGDELVLRTPPMADGSGATVVNELAWTRDVS